MNDPHALREGEAFDGPVRTLTRADFEQFSGLTGDRHPIHHDAEYAKSTRFGQPVAHGLHLAALTALGASTGSGRSHGFVLVEQGTKFLKPAVSGDTLRSRLIVERLWKEEGRRFCRLKTELYNQRGERVLEGFHLYRLFDPPQSGKGAP
jgi:3-hydroxybutyryl-CoA dehydratase